MVFALYSGAIRDLKFNIKSAIISPYFAKFMKRNKSTRHTILAWDRYYFFSNSFFKGYLCD